MDVSADGVGGRLLNALGTNLLEDGHQGRGKAGGKERERQMHRNSVFLHFPEHHLILHDISYGSDFINLGTFAPPFSMKYGLLPHKIECFLLKMRAQ